MNATTTAPAVDALTANARTLRAALADGTPLPAVFGPDRPRAATNIRAALAGMHPDLVVAAWDANPTVIPVHRCLTAWRNGRAYLRENYASEAGAWLDATEGADAELALIASLI